MRRFPMHLSDIGVSPDMRPVFLKHLSAERIDFDLEFDFTTRSFKT